MKTIASIAHFNGKEQQALRFIINRIKTQWHPQLVYRFRSQYTATLDRNCLGAKKNTSTWRFDCGLLVLVADDVIVMDGLQKERTALINPYGKLDLRIHTLSFFKEQIKEGSPFFTNVEKQGMLLYKKGK